jgi:hypothetical protein
MIGCRRSDDMIRCSVVVLAVALPEVAQGAEQVQRSGAERRETVRPASQPASHPSESAVAPGGDFKGMWYCCGTANTLPGHKFVYSGGKATYSAWHRPMAVYAKQVDRTFFVFGTPGNCPAISSFDHKTGAFDGPVVLGPNIDGNAHRNPTLLIDEKGLIYVFRGRRPDVEEHATHYDRLPILTQPRQNGAASRTEQRGLSGILVLRRCEVSARHERRLPLLLRGRDGRR